MKSKGNTIRQRLMKVIFWTSATVLTLTCIGYFTYEYIRFQQETVRQLKTTGEMIAATSTAALAFDNKDNAEEILNTLKADEHIVAACLYDEKGNLFASYPDSISKESFPQSPAADGYRFKNRHLDGFQPIEEGNARLGTLYLSSNMDIMYERLPLYAGIVCIVVLISYVLAYLLSRRLHDTILNPVFSLAEASKIVSAQGDYSTRAKKYVDDELGSLTDAFNNMLARIEVQNEEIKSFNLLLEHRVSERTNELESANNILKEQKEFVETIVNSSVDSITVFNVNLEYVIVNKHAEKIYKMPKEDIIGKHVLELFPWLKASGMYNDLLKTLQGEPIHQSKYKSNELKRYFENFYIPLKDGKNHVYGVLAIGHDITEIIDANERLQKVNNELLRSNSELEQFAYIASHDLQEPLRKIQVFSELAATNMHDADAEQKYLEKISSSAKSMTELIKAVLNYSQLSRNLEDFSRVDINKVLENVKTDLELIITEKAASITSDILPAIEGIPFQLNQLFLNLIANSLKFSDKTPVISIVSRIITGHELNNILQGSGDSTNQLDPKRKYLELVFKDNGIGFEQQYTRQVFTIFKRLHSKQEYPGTGIGLALVKKIVENHDGFIRVRSDLGKGSIFNIYLPVERLQSQNM